LRPKILPGTPLEYSELMEQCLDADLTKRPNISTLFKKIKHIYKTYLQNENNEQQTNNDTSISNAQLYTNFSVSSSVNNSIYRNSSSKVYNYKDLPEPRNAIKGKYYLL
jgi:hypothetical protein